MTIQTEQKSDFFKIELKDSGKKGIISLYGEIGWDKSALNFIRELNDLNCTEIDLRVHSDGGSMFDGSAMFNAIRSHPATVTGYIDGVAASMAGYLLLACDQVKVYENSYFMMHNPQMGFYGDINRIKQETPKLQNLTEHVVSQYAKYTGNSEDDVREMCEKTTWMVGQQIVDKGFATEVIDGDVVVASLSDKERAFFGGFNPPTGFFDRFEMKDRKGTMSVKTQEKNGDESGTVKPPVTTPGSVSTEPQMSAEERRKSEIQGIFTMLNRGDDVSLLKMQVKLLADESVTVDNARQQVLEMMGRENTPSVGRNDAHIHSSNGRIIVDCLSNAVAARADLEELESDNSFASMSLLEMSREALRNRGVGCAGLSRTQIASMAFTHTSGDFGEVLGNTARKSMLKGVGEAEETFPIWTQKGNLNDFKINSRVGVGNFSELDKLGESGEYRTGDIKDHGEQIQLATYGKKFSINRHMIINDDLRAFTVIPKKMGMAAIRTVGSVVYQVLISNPKMKNGRPLFHSAHNNISKEGDFISVDSVEAALIAMGLQADAEGNTLGIRAGYLITPFSLGGKAQSVIDSKYHPDKAVEVSNPVYKQVEVVPEPRLDSAFSGGALPWFVVGKRIFDTLEVAYLDGNDKPVLEQQSGWDVDGTEFKVRIDAGVAPLSAQTFYKNLGKK